MITIRSSTDITGPGLLGLEVTIETADGTYSMSSEGAVAESHSPIAGGLFGAISWPQSRFQLPGGAILEQQMFLPDDGSAMAVSWRLSGNKSIAARIIVRPFFSGCGPRTYRGVGFRNESEAEGGRLTWLPNVLGPRIIADTNGRYFEEFVEREDLLAPGSFEFEISERPSVLIFSNESVAGNERNQHVGTFLAGLMPQSANPNSKFVRPLRSLESATSLVAAA